MPRPIPKAAPGDWKAVSLVVGGGIGAASRCFRFPGHTQPVADCFLCCGAGALVNLLAYIFGLRQGKRPATTRTVLNISCPAGVWT